MTKFNKDSRCLVGLIGSFLTKDTSMYLKIILLLPVLFSMGGCLRNDTERGIAGAAGGAVISGAIGGSPAAGALVGGAAGYFCRDLNVPGCQNN